MNRLLTTVLLAATATGFSFADYTFQPSDFKWYTGAQSPSPTNEIVNGTTTSIGKIGGDFVGEGTFAIGTGNAEITGPISNRFPTSPKTSAITEWKPGSAPTIDGFKFSVSNSDFTSINTPGDYVVTIPEGAFTVNGEKNAKFTVTFTIADNRTYNPSIALYVTPGTGEFTDAAALKEALANVQVTLDNGTSGNYLYTPVGYDNSQVKFTNVATGESVACTIASATAGVGGQIATWRMVVTLPEEALDLITGPGSYTLTLGEKAIKVQGQANTSEYYTNQATTITYTIPEPAPVPTTVDLNATWKVGSESSTAVVYTEGKLNSLTNIYGTLAEGNFVLAEGAQATIKGGNVDITAPISAINTLDADQNPVPSTTTFQIKTGQSIVTPGTYTLTIPAAAMTVDGKEINAFTKDFVVTAINYVPTAFNWTYTTNPNVNNILSSFAVSTPNTNEAGSQIYQNMGVAENAQITVKNLQTEEVTSLGVKTASATGMIRYEAVFGDKTFEKGMYQVTVPAGTFHIYNNEADTYLTNEELTQTYNVGATVNLADKVTWKYGTGYATALPYEGSMLSLNFIFGDVAEGTLEVAENQTVAITGPNDYNKTAALSKVVTGTDADGQPIYANAFRFEAGNNVTVEGEYTVTIPAGAMTIDGASNETYTTTFVVKDTRTYTPTQLTWVVSDTKADNNLRAFSVLTSNKDADGKVIYLNRGVKDGAVVYVNNIITGEHETFPIASAVAADGIKYAVDFGGKVIANGRYSLTIPQGTFHIFDNENGEYLTNIEINVFYDFVSTVVVPVSDPANNETVKALTTVTLSAPEGYTGLKLTNPAKNQADLYGSELPENVALTMVENEDGTITITMPEALANGEYNLEIASGYLTAGNVVLGPQSFYWKVDSNFTGVAGIEADGLFTVYSIDGKVVMNKVEASQLNRLPKGLYIINGKKYVVR